MSGSCFVSPAVMILLLSTTLWMYMYPVHVIPELAKIHLCFINFSHIADLPLCSNIIIM